MEITGKIIVVMPAREGVSQSSGNPWKSQDYVIETQEMYPKKCCFNVFGAEKIQQFNIQPGEMLTVSLGIDANEYQGRWYNKISAWQVQRVAQGQAQQVQQQGCQPYYPDMQAPYPQQGIVPQQQAGVQTQAPAQVQPQGQQPQNDSLPF
ncbi:MAG: DUF3127 domain-containing protein [Prevotella sp.]